MLDLDETSGRSSGGGAAARPASGAPGWMIADHCLWLGHGDAEGRGRSRLLERVI